MKILNLDNRDYHIHTSTFSDWLSTIDEIVRFAWEIGLTEIAITDHSQFTIDKAQKKHWFFPAWARYSLKTWKNVHNDVNVIFWVEGDLINDDWDICSNIQWKEANFLILAAHFEVFEWNPENITNATIKAIERNHERIKFIAHPCNNSDFWKYYDIEKLVKVANEYNIPLELNAKNLQKWKTNLEKLDYMLKNANEIYINSDAHNLWELKESRKFAINFLKENKYI